MVLNFIEIEGNNEICIPLEKINYIHKEVLNNYNDEVMSEKIIIEVEHHIIELSFNSEGKIGNIYNKIKECVSNTYNTGIVKIEGYFSILVDQY